MVDESSAIFCAVMGMDSQTGPLVDQKDMLVFIDDVQLGRSYSQIGIVLSGLIEKFVIDVQLKHIAYVQSGVPLDPFTVAFDPLQADIFLGKGSRQQGNGFG